MNTDSLQSALAATPHLELVILIGSRATGTATSESDWDIAIQWPREMTFFEQLAATEKLRHDLSMIVHMPDQAIDWKITGEPTLSPKGANGLLLSQTEIFN